MAAPSPAINTRPLLLPIGVASPFGQSPWPVSAVPSGCGNTGSLVGPPAGLKSGRPPTGGCSRSWAETVPGGSSLVRSFAPPVWVWPG
ncbi:hypothetical protein PtB15_3B359 [Puccinia triticina]|nr:hypothetical protein PtB15_3B359 [Puccinia triticina]